MQTMIPPDLFERYIQNPVEWDATVRQQLKLPEDRYYCVSIWPWERAGRVTVDNRARKAPAAKISKSNQP